MARLFAAILLAAGLFGTATPASAQVARDGNYYEEVKSAFCNAFFPCAVEFSPVPQLILFSKINCQVQVQATVSVIMTGIVFEIRDVSGPSQLPRRREWLQIPPPSSVGSSNIYNLVSPTDFMMSASKFPTIETFFSGSGVFNVECKITGRLQ